ncbi:MAG: hypothetical protein QNJ72_29270 [Pleurocapsa sp. MO_226.B13]|nr:hypothetical protein [Pleurocapsa sp. MO_226.B13]
MKKSGKPLGFNWAIAAILFSTIGFLFALAGLFFANLNSHTFARFPEEMSSHTIRISMIKMLKKHFKYEIVNHFGCARNCLVNDK